MNYKKYINIHKNILIEWIYKNGIITDNYSILSNLKYKKRNFLSKSNNNNINYTLFEINNVYKRYAKVDTKKYNFLKIQDYFSPPFQYDKINIHFPFNYDFDNYIGLLLKIYVLDFDNKEKIYLSDYYYDKTDINSDKIIQLNKPFTYGEMEWGKYITISIPSIDDISNDRVITNDSNTPTPNSINYNLLSNNRGISTTTPIFIEVSFITSKENSINDTYFYLGDTFKVSIPKSPEYKNLGVVVKESDNWDYFEIYGIYENSNENLDNFIRDLEDSGRRINIEYIITLYEENLQSGYPVRFLVTENFAQKIEYRPIFKYSNTTAAIDVEMHIKDLVDNTSIVRKSSLGLTKNLFKYGKKLISLKIDNINKPKIYNYRSNNTINNSSNITSINTYGITKVPYPILITNYKILLSNNTSNENSDYKPLGSLVILLTPFDNVIKLKIVRQLNKDGTPETYDLSEILSNAKLTLIFKSDTETVEKHVFYETDENNIKEGIVVFKILESDMKIIKNIKNSDDNFYLTVIGNNTRTLLYSGKFKIYEDVKFIDDINIYPTTVPPNKNTDIIEDKSLSSSSTNDSISSQYKNTEIVINKPDIYKSEIKKKKENIYIDEVLDKNSLLKEDNIPNRPTMNQPDLYYYRNLIIYTSMGLSQIEMNKLKQQIKNLSLSIYYQYQNTIIIERCHLNKILNIKHLAHVDNVIELKLNLGWDKVLPPTNVSISNKNDNNINQQI